jgi:cell division protein FtsZ
MVEDADDTPLYTEQHYADRQPQKSGGWMSLFGGGRQRYDQQPAPQQPQARSTTSARPAMQPLESQQVDEGEDLEIPSFLRRLAN